MREHRWSLIFRTISNGNIGSAPSIMLNAVSMKIKTPVRPTPALQGRKERKKREKNQILKIVRQFFTRHENCCTWQLDTKGYFVEGIER